VLWERWFPKDPSMEMLDDKIQEGYRANDEVPGVPRARTKAWLVAWDWYRHISKKHKLTSIAAFDDRFGATQCVFNWVQDLESELWSAGHRDPKMRQKRIEISKACIPLFSPTDALTIANMKIAVAESHFDLGRKKMADKLFRKWLDQDPTIGTM
ncbi:MAG: SEC-C metal-binding domain-containing protein, partial [Blastocatellia bacterium]